MNKVELEISIEQFLEKWELAVRLRENKNLGRVYDAETTIMKRMTDSLRNTLMENNGEEWI